MDAMINAHAVTFKVKKIPPNAASDLERESGFKPSQVPTIRRLHVDKTFPPDHLLTDKSFGIGLP